MSDRALVVVTRVAEAARHVLPEISEPNPSPRWSFAQHKPPSRFPPVPTPDWLEKRAQYLERITAASLRRVSVPLVWVWRVHPVLQAQAQAIADRIYPEAVIVDQELTLPEVLPDVDKFIVVRLDSDDAFIPARLDELAEMEVEADALVNWWGGYKYNTLTGEVALWEWHAWRQGPFFAVARDGRGRMFDVPMRHELAREGISNLVQVDDRAWIWTYHGGNAMNRWRTQKMTMLPSGEAQAVLAEAGVQPCA